MAQPNPMRSPDPTDKVIYTAKTHTTGGRENGVARSSDGQLEVRLSTPGSGRPGTNPEQMFAAGWSACFEGALGLVAHRKKLKLPPETAIDAEVDLHLDRGEFFLSARLNISIPGIERTIAQELVDEAQDICPYSRAIHGNVEVAYNLV
jgi:Ohr subfamily peroxiredoxin